jgi:anti-anti-sigma factor
VADSATPAFPLPPRVVTLPAEIDIGNAYQIGLELRAAFAPGVPAVVADMTDTTFCDSMGARMLVLAHKTALANDAELLLALPSSQVLRILAITGLDQVLPIYPSLGSALLAAQADRASTTPAAGS